jgi:hypothetical protein
MVVPGIEPGPLDLQQGTLTARPQKRSTFFYITYTHSVRTSQEAQYIFLLLPGTLTTRPQRRSNTKLQISKSPTLYSHLPQWMKKCMKSWGYHAMCNFICIHGAYLGLLWAPIRCLAFNAWEETLFHRILVGKSFGMQSLEIRTRRWEDNIKRHFKETKIVNGCYMYHTQWRFSLQWC